MRREKIKFQSCKSHVNEWGTKATSRLFYEYDDAKQGKTWTKATHLPNIHINIIQLGDPRKKKNNDNNVDVNEHDECDDDSNNSE